MICIAWDGLASYSEAAIRKFIETTKEKVAIVAILPSVPKTTADVIAGVKINWIKRDYAGSLSEAVGCSPDVLLVGGWYLPVFNRFTAEVRGGGGYVITMQDNQFEFNWKLIPWIVRFNLCFRWRYAAYMVPGKCTAKLLHWCGIRDRYIGRSLYTANPEVFTDGGPLERRKKKMLYIGRFIGLKNVLSMIDAFSAFAARHPEWELHCYGQGNLQSEMEQLISDRKCRQIVIHKFVQPSELAGLYKDARVLVLPSFWDHWGVVVHEAALSGCAVLLSDRVGAGWNLCTKKNGVLFNPYKKKSLGRALEKIAGWDDSAWRTAHEESLRIAKTISPEMFARELERIVKLVKGGNHV